MREVRSRLLYKIALVVIYIIGISCLYYLYVENNFLNKAFPFIPFLIFLMYNIISSVLKKIVSDLILILLLYSFVLYYFL